MDAGTRRRIGSAGGRAWAGLAAVVLWLGGAGCDGEGDPTKPGTPEVSVVEVGPISPVVTVGDTVRLTAVPRTADGTPVTVAIAWSSEDEDVATVQGTGGAALVTGRAAGTVQVKAHAGGRMGWRYVTVVAEPGPEPKPEPEPKPAPATLELSRGPLQLLAGDHAEVRVLVKAADGQVLDGHTATWSSDSALVATVAPAGAPGGAVVTATGPGQTRIVARAAGLEIGLIVTVSAPSPAAFLEMRPAQLLVETGVAVDLLVHGWGPDGGWLPDFPVTWRSSDPSMASVTGSGPTGRVRGLRAGQVEVFATSGATVAKAVVTIADGGTVGSVEVTPAKSGVWVGSYFRLEAKVLSPAGGVMSGQPVAWRVSDPERATIQADGLLYARGPGSFEVYAESGGKRGVAAIRIHAPLVLPAHLVLAAQEDTTGAYRPRVPMGDTTWTDPSGAVLPARRFLAAGSMILRSGAWEQTVTVETVVSRNGILDVVARTSHTDSGKAYHDFTGVPAWIFVSDLSGRSFEGAMHEAGRLVARQQILGSPEVGLVWRLP